MLVEPDLMVVVTGTLVILVENGLVLDLEVIVLRTWDVFTMLVELDLMVVRTGMLVTLVE